MIRLVVQRTDDQSIIYDNVLNRGTPTPNRDELFHTRSTSFYVEQRSVSYDDSTLDATVLLAVMIVA